jgi:hypothetical protein
MIHVTIDAKDTQELHRELRALLEGTAAEPQVLPLQPARFLKVTQPEEPETFQPEPDPEPDPEPVPVPVPDVESNPATDFVPGVTPAPEQPSMTDCRAVLNKIRANEKYGPAVVREILSHYGVERFTALDASQYADVIKEAEQYEV